MSPGDLGKSLPEYAYSFMDVFLSAIRATAQSNGCHSERNEVELKNLRTSGSKRLRAFRCYGSRWLEIRSTPALKYARPSLSMTLLLK